MSKPKRKPTILFSRKDVDVHGDPFEHRLLYAEHSGKWKAWIWSRGEDRLGRKTTEEWDTVSDADGFFRLLVDNLYLFLSRGEVAEVVMPALRKVNSRLADDASNRIAKEGLPFPGD